MKVPSNALAGDECVEGLRFPAPLQNVATVAIWISSSALSENLAAFALER